MAASHMRVGRMKTSREDHTQFEHFVQLVNTEGAVLDMWMRYEPVEALFLATEMAQHMDIPCLPLVIDGVEVELDEISLMMLRKDWKVDMDEYPLHDEMKARLGEHQGIQATIDWLAKQGYVICEYHFKDRPLRDSEYRPIQLRDDRLVAAILGIDYDAFMAEKDAMLAVDAGAE